MADNVGYTPGTGATVAADDIGGVLYQRVKIGVGDDGLAVDVSATNPLPVSATNLPLPTGAATSINQPDIATSAPAITARGSIMRQAPTKNYVIDFAGSGSGLLTSQMTQRTLGTGVTVSQSNGAFVVNAGTSTNAEYLARSTVAFSGPLLQRHRLNLSQRINNNTFTVMLADVIAEGVSCTINSSTSITVTTNASIFTADCVGQNLFVGAINGAAGVPGKWAISAVTPGVNVTFTVAGWPASGTCTVDLFGYNYMYTQYSGTVATTGSFDAQRNGWSIGATSTTTVTTATGHLCQIQFDGRMITFGDTSVGSSTSPVILSRASRQELIPEDTTQFYFYIWSFNGTTAPASSTALTINSISIEQTPNLNMFISGFKLAGEANRVPVNISAFSTAIAAGTNIIGDTGLTYRANNTNAGSVANVLSPATPAGQQIKATAGRIVNITLVNSGAATRWLKLFNLATVTPGTSTAIAEIALPVNQVVSMSMEGGIGFSTAISVMITGGQGLTNNTAITANDVTGMIGFA